MSQNSYGALKIAGNTTATYAPNAAAKLTQGWAAHGVSQQGDAAVAPSAANSRLVLQPGVYLVQLSLEAEGESAGGTSGDATGVITFQLYQAGVALTGPKTQIDTQAADRPQSVHLHDIVHITKAQYEAGTNYVEVYHAGGDASGNDVLVSNAVFSAVRIAG